MYDVIALGELLVDLAERAKMKNGSPRLPPTPAARPAIFLPR